MQVLILDTDALIRLAENLYRRQKKAVDHVFTKLLLEYSEIWVPSAVFEEFTVGRYIGRRERGLRRKPGPVRTWSYLQRRWPGRVLRCPVKVKPSEISLALTPHLQPGEVDAAIQGRQILSNDRYRMRIRGIGFLSGDNHGLDFAEGMGLVPVRMDALIDSLKQEGVPV